MTGHYTGTWKSNGKKFKTNAVHIWTVEDGKLVHFSQATETTEITGD